MAGNLARDEARTAIRRRRHLTLLRSEVEVDQEEAPNPEEVLDRARQRARVRSALGSLSERDREVLLLSYTEIAEQTGLAAGAVGTTLARARRRLKDAYQARHEEENDAARG